MLELVQPTTTIRISEFIQTLTTANVVIMCYQFLRALLYRQLQIAYCCFKVFSQLLQQQYYCQCFQPNLRDVALQLLVQHVLHQDQLLLLSDTFFSSTIQVQTVERMEAGRVVTFTPVSICACTNSISSCTARSVIISPWIAATTTKCTKIFHSILCYSKPFSFLTADTNTVHKQK